MGPMTRELTPLRRLLQHARSHRWRILRAALWSILNKVFDLAPPLLIGVAVDLVVKREESFLARLGVPTVEDQLVVLSVLTFLIWSAESAFEYLHKLGWRNLAQDVQHELRVEAYDRVQQMDLAYFEDSSTGRLMSILNDDVNQLERFLDVGANELLQVATTAVTIGAAFFWMAPEVAWMSMLPMPLVLWGSIAFQKRLAPRYVSVRREVGELNGDLAGNLGGIATIKAFSSEARETERIQARSQSYKEANARAIRLSSAFSPLIRMVILCGFTATLAYGGLLAARGELEVGVYSVMVFLTQRLLWPLTRLGETFDLYQRAMASASRILDVFELEPGIQSGTHDVPAEVRSLPLHLDGVSFRYSTGGDILSEVDLTMEPGRTTAIVGSTGSGKTTLVKLLMRFYDPTQGALRIGDRDLRDLRVGDWRGAVGLVSQDVFLFHGTVRENIAYGLPSASDEQIREAARTAEAEEFILRLPEGYDTIVGERGQKLSGGQRQRLSIARAILTDPAILILDEATSAVDNETEAAIQRSLERVSLGRTTVVIAHRLSTIRGAHRILVLDGGRVVESGTHDSLLTQNSHYAKLWRVQTGSATMTPSESS